MTVPPFETDTWPVCRPIVEWLTRRMPAGGHGYERPEWSERDQQELADRFFASRFGAPLDDVDHRSLLESVIWFGTGYGPGDPLRWSSVAVEIILDGLDPAQDRRRPGLPERRPAPAAGVRPVTATPNGGFAPN